MKAFVALISVFTLAALGLAGYNQKNMSGLDANIETKVDARIKKLLEESEKLQRRIARLEIDNTKLKAEVASLTTDKEEILEDLAQLAEPAPLAVQAGKTNQPPTPATIRTAQPASPPVAQEVAKVFAYEFRRHITAYEEEKEAEREAEREARRQEEAERREERELQRVAELADELGLDENQAERLQVVRASMREAMSEIFQSFREPGVGFDRDTIRDTMGKIREQHVKQVSEFLNDEQLKTYTEKEIDRYARGWFGGRGGDRRNDAPTQP